MGWLFMQTLKGHSGPRQYLDAQFTYQHGAGFCRVLRSALVGMRTYYAACEIGGENRLTEVVAIVCLVRFNRRDKEGYIFGYKDMDESMGPCEAACPAEILDLLTYTTCPNAVLWRDRCRENLAERRSKPKLAHGQTIVFDEPIAFIDGASFERMTVVIDPRRPRSVRFAAPGQSWGCCRISRLKARAWRIEASVV